MTILSTFFLLGSKCSLHTSVVQVAISWLEVCKVHIPEHTRPLYFKKREFYIHISQLFASRREGKIYRPRVRKEFRIEVRSLPPHFSNRCTSPSQKGDLASKFQRQHYATSLHFFARL